jgi:hypothetical protein
MVLMVMEMMIMIIRCNRNVSHADVGDNGGARLILAEEIILVELKILNLVLVITVSYIIN